MKSMVKPISPDRLDGFWDRVKPKITLQQRNVLVNTINIMF